MSTTVFIEARARLTNTMPKSTDFIPGYGRAQTVYNYPGNTDYVVMPPEARVGTRVYVPPHEMARGPVNTGYAQVPAAAVPPATGPPYGLFHWGMLTYKGYPVSWSLARCAVPLVRRASAAVYAHARLVVRSCEQIKTMLSHSLSSSWVPMVHGVLQLEIESLGQACTRWLPCLIIRFRMRQRKFCDCAHRGSRI